jgi:two-component system CheB/CheR fusion protein
MPLSKVASKITKTKKQKAKQVKKKVTKKIKVGLAPKVFPIVGFGASAGGLEAFSKVLEALPTDTGMAFILVQHLDPTHESMATEILSHTTRMPVHEVKDGVKVLPNHVYLIPPNFNMAILQGVLSLLPRTKVLGQQMTINFFFQSLAQDQKGRAIGVVLSGTASDGTQGLESIKAEGGLVLAQEPSSAKFDGMPNSAIASGVVDFILSPEDIAHELVRISKHLEDETQQLALRKIFVLLQTETGNDFKNYKYTTLKRRMERRMVVQKTETLVDYAKYLNENKDEIKALYADILINVTEFFRDPESYRALTQHVFPSLIKNRDSVSPIRIWVAACSTGEEVYSIAILLLEFLGDESAKIPIQIFATDISESVLQKARAGIYSEAIERVVTKERLKRFFERVEGGYKVNKGIRGLCLFSRHDVTSDPPFAKLDLVSCRNVLIYFETVLQRRVFPVIHFALKSGGFLWLGRSESPGESSRLFSSVDKIHKIYSKINIQTPLTFRFPVSAYVPDVMEVTSRVSENIQGHMDYQRDVDRIALSKYAPPSVVVNSDLEILQFRGRTVPYLESPSGAPSHQLLKMIRNELLHDLRVTLQTAKKQNRPARKEGVSFEVNGKRRMVNIEVIPVNPVAQPKQRNFVIFFEETSSLPVLPVSKGSREKINQKIDQLERDFTASKQCQVLMAEEFDVTQEELRSANEELQSSNEKHQSTNEELETAKEELQSSNEELTTLNDELKNRNADLVTFSSDLNNVLSSVDVPILLVGNDHRIRRFTPKAEQVFKLIPGDIGRPISDISPSFDLDLDALISEVIESLRPQEHEVKDRQWRWMRLQIRPYKTIDNRIDGAVITLVDIEALKQSLNVSEMALEHAKSIADTVPIPFFVLGGHLLVKSANPSFYDYFNISKEKNRFSFIDLLDTPRDQIQKLKKAMNETLSLNTPFYKIEIDHESLYSGHRKLLLSGRQIDWIGSEPQAMLIAIEDITELKLVEQKLKESEKQISLQADSLREALRSRDEFLSIASHELKTPITALALQLEIARRTVKPDEGIAPSPEKLAKTLDISIRQVEKMTELIEDLLDISRIESGKMSYCFERCDVAKLVGEVLERFSDQLKSVNCILELTRVDSVIVTCDSFRIDQVITNLITNAIKYGAGSLVRVHVSASDDLGVKFSVSDGGIGIAKKKQAKVFDRFERVINNVSVSGLGLGLYISKQIVDAHGGSIELESELGKGAKFTVQLPLAPPYNAK